MSKWYQIKARKAKGDEQSSAELLIYGDIGESWFAESVTAAELVRDLQQIDAAHIDVRINSMGGSVPDGLAIYNALRRYPGTVHTHVDGLAASIASLITMAGEKVFMAPNAMMMIHAPWGAAIGNAQELRERADVLDQFAQAMAGCYDRTGEGADKHLALLTDGDDHYFTADEAIEAGYADELGEGLKVAASARRERLATLPAAAAAFFTSSNPQGAKMDPKANPAATKPATDDLTDPKAAVVEPQKPDGGAPEAAVVPFVRSAAQTAEIRAMFNGWKAHDGVQTLLEDVLADTSVTPEAAGKKLLAAMASGAEPLRPAGAPRIQTLSDEVDKRRGAEIEAILARAGVRAEGKAPELSANPFRGFRLMDFARAALARAGVRTDGMSQMDVVAAAITQGTTDFPVLLENVMHKSLLGAYATQPATWTRFCKTGSVSDFRAHHRYRTGSFGNLDAKNELGEFKAKAIPDGQKMSISASTKGNIVTLSREAIINDDLGAFVGLAAALGRAAKRTIDVDVFALLAENSGAGPTMSDSKAFFHADHGNVGTAGIPAVSSFDEVRTLMRQQKDISNNDYLDLIPEILLVHTSNAGAARVINDAQYDPDTANKLQRPNMVRGMYRDIVDSPRVSSAKKWYSFCDPNIAAAFEVAFLDGVQEPYLELQMGWTVDGAQYKVRLDYGVAAQDPKAAVYNAGE